MRLRPFLPVLGPALLVACMAMPHADESVPRRWLAGDHHVHSRYSVGWTPPYEEWAAQAAQAMQPETDPTLQAEPQPAPQPEIGGDAIYPIPMNTLAAKYYGLAWIVATDHGGPNHSKISLSWAYPELLFSRRLVPEVIQFFGMELDPPGADHASLIIPHDHDEAQHLYAIESRFDKFDAWPLESERGLPAHMLKALEFMDGMQRKPVVIANHPARSAAGMGMYGLDEPGELRDWNDAAPEVAVGMAGAPGHQAATLAPDGTPTRGWARGAYSGYPTLGGFDQLTARVGGFWDSMLGEGRRWWITANSDSHINFTEGGMDFWPGEYSKTWVWARPEHDDVLDGLRNGRVFVATGDLVSELYLSARSAGARADTGGRLEVPVGADIEITVRFLDPDAANHHGDNPAVARVDLIVGRITGPVADRTTDTHGDTEVVRRFTARDWAVDGAYRVITHTLKGVDGPLFVRVRGTNTDQPEPLPDLPTEDPWQDLWFYSNPVFITIR